MIRVTSLRQATRPLSFASKGTRPAQSASRSVRIACCKRSSPTRGSFPTRAACPSSKAITVCWPHQPLRYASTASSVVFPGPNSLSPPDLSSHYSIFPNTLPLGPPPVGPFDIDLTSLRREFLQLQGRFHPDKFPPEQKAKAEALSSRINEAYKTLRDPLVRAQYILLHNYGIDVTSEDNSSHPVDLSILMEVMEAQESIEEAETEDQIIALKEQNQERIEDTLKSLDGAFSSGNAEAARADCIRLRYWASLGEGLNAWNGKGSEVRLMH
jgi:molecular chaperone HscB